MTCIGCKRNTAYKFGTYGKRRIQRYRCHCRVHSSLRVTPAMEAGRTDHVWSLAELLSA
jgi:transposase-like protein